MGAYGILRHLQQYISYIVRKIKI